MLLVLVVAPAWALKPNTEPPKEDPNRAENVRKAHLTISCEGQERDGGEAFNGTAEIWFDRDQGLYRLHISLTVVARGKAEEVEAHIYVSPERTVYWEREGRKERNPKQRALKTEAGAEPAFEKLAHNGDVGGLMVPYVDAAFGFKRLRTEANMEAAESPLAEKDELRWYELKERPDAHRGLVQELNMLGDKARVWLGVSPETGWPMKHAVRGEKGGAFTFTLTKVDAKPDLKGVFDLPAEVKAKLKGEK